PGHRRPVVLGGVRVGVPRPLTGSPRSCRRTGSPQGHSLATPAGVAQPRRHARGWVHRPRRPGRPRPRPPRGRAGGRRVSAPRAASPAAGYPPGQRPPATPTRSAAMSRKLLTAAALALAVLAACRAAGQDPLPAPDVERLRAQYRDADLALQ